MASPNVPIKVRALYGRRRGNLLEGMRHLLKSQQVAKPAWFDAMEKCAALILGSRRESVGLREVAPHLSRLNFDTLSPRFPPITSPEPFCPPDNAEDTWAAMARLYALRRPLDFFPAFRHLVRAGGGGLVTSCFGRSLLEPM